MSALRLRDFAAGDDAALIGWVGSPEELERFAGPTLSWPLTMAQLDGLRADPAVSAWSAYTDPLTRAAVGHVELVRVGPRAGRIVRVLLDPRRRGEGLARPLVAAAVSRARALGITDLGLKVFADNAPAIRAYRALGFEDVGEDPADPRVRVHALRTDVAS